MRLNLFSGKDQKTRVDEVLEDYLGNNGYQQSFKDELSRIGIEYVSVAAALYVYYLERTVPFRDSRFFVGFLCTVYFGLQIISYLWNRFVEKNAMYIGHNTSTQEKVWICTSNPSNTSKYVVKVYTTQGEIGTHTFEYPSIVDGVGIVHPEKLRPVLDLLNKKAQ